MPVRKSRKARPAQANAPIILRRGRGRLRVKRTATEPQFDLSVIAGRTAREPGMPEPGWPSGAGPFLSAVLRAQGVPELVVQRIAAALPTTVPPNTRLTTRLAEALAIVLDLAPIEEILNSAKVMLMGPVGAGKTTLAAKLAAKADRQPAHLITIDTSDSGRAQIEEYARALGVPLSEAAAPEALGAATSEAMTHIVDTAGLAIADELAWEELRPWIAASQAMPVLVLPGNILVEDAIVAARAFHALGGHHVVVTRFDMVRRIGGVLGAAMEGLAMAGVSVTPHFAYGLRPLTADTLSWRLLSGALEEDRWRAPAA